MKLKESFNFFATAMGGIGTFIFGIGTVTELLGATPGRNGFDGDATLLTATALAVSAGLLYTGIRGYRKAAADNHNDPKPPAP